MAQPTTKNLLKILIGVAWIDGKVQPEERDYLQRIAKENGLASDPEIHPILNELVAVKPEQCHAWVEDYLGDRPSSETCQTLIEALSALIYSDDDVATEEAKLLAEIQMKDPVTGNQPKQPAILSSIQKLYRRWLSSQQ